MIDREHDLPISRQAEALGVSRGAVYYKPRPTSTEDLRILPPPRPARELQRTDPGSSST